MTTREILVAAKALVDTPEKWGKSDERPFAQHDGDGMRCALLALCHACPSTRGLFTTCKDLVARTVYGGVVPPSTSSFTVITRWNDAPERTHEDVMAAFDRAIEAASEESDDGN